MPVRMVESGSLRGFGLRLSCMVAQPEGIAGQYFGLFDRERDRDMVRQKGSRFKDGGGVAAICHRSDDQAQLINESILQKGLLVIPPPATIRREMPNDPLSLRNSREQSRRSSPANR